MAPLLANPATAKAGETSANDIVEDLSMHLRNAIASIKKLDWKDSKTYTTDVDGISQVTMQQTGDYLLEFYTV
jgi:hypothetical protein